MKVSTTFNGIMLIKWNKKEQTGMPEEPTIINTKSGKFHITERVWKILKLMAEHNYISGKELQRIYGDRKSIWRKIKPLQEEYFINSFPTQLNPKTVYCLTAKGYRFLAKYNALRISRTFKPSEFRTTSLAHTLACIQTQLAFEKHSYILNYFSTKVLSAGKDQLPTLQPDAEFSFRENLMPGAQHFRGAVEVELSRKSPSRNQERMRKYDARSDLKIVVWVCGNNYILRDLQSIIRSLRLGEPKKFRFVLYEDVLKNGLIEAVAVDWTSQRWYIIFEILKYSSSF